MRESQKSYEAEKEKLLKKISDLELGKGKSARGSKKGKRKEKESSDSDSDSDPKSSKRVNRRLSKIQKQLDALTKRTQSQDPSKNKEAELPFDDDCLSCPDCPKTFKTNRGLVGHYMKFHRARSEQRYIPPLI